MPLTIRQGQWRRGNFLVISGDGVIRCIASRGTDDNTVASARSLADGSRRHVDNQRPVGHRLRIDGAVEPAGVPVGSRPEKRPALPAIVAEHPMGQPLAGGVENIRHGGEIRIEDDERQ